MRFANYNMFGLPDYNNTEIPSIPYSTIRTHTQEILKVSMPSSWCSVFQFHSHENASRLSPRHLRILCTHKGLEILPQRVPNVHPTHCANSS